MSKNTLRAALALAASMTMPACAAPPPPPVAAPSCSSDAVVAKFGATSITLGELDKSAGRELFEAREKALDNLVTERALTPEAKKAGLSLEDYVRKAVEAKVPEVSEAEAQKFYEANQSKLGPQFEGKKFEDVKPMIIQGLTGQKRQEAVGDVIEDLRKKAGVQVLLEAPKVEVAATGPARGPKDAKVTIVEFSDFQCPYCARGRQVIDQVVKAYPDKVRVVFRHFPLPFHDHAEKAAEAALCANEQGEPNFWKLHDWMFDNQKTLAVDDLKKGAKSLGLDSVKFDACLDGGKGKALIDVDQKAGKDIGVNGTPAFVINGTFLSGAQPFEKFKAEIDKAIAK